MRVRSIRKPHSSKGAGAAQSGKSEIGLLAFRAGAYAALQLGLFVLAVYLVVLSTPLHLFLFERLGTAKRLILSSDALAEIARAMTAAMRGEGVEALTRFFGADEVLHMQDVRALLLLAKRALIGLFAMYALGMAATRRLSRRGSARAAGIALLICIALVGFLAFAFSKDFYGSFLVFHRVFFPGNELWLMDPATQFMVVVYDQEFFVWASVCVGALAIVSLLPLCWVWLKGRKPAR